MKISCPLLLRPFTLSVLLFLATACFDEIQLDLPASEEQKLVIEGYVNKGAEFLDVLITIGTNAAVTDQGGNVQPVPVDQAYLIYNDVPFPQYPLPNNEVTRLPADAFESTAPSNGPPVFQLFVALPDGRTFRSDPETLPALPQAEKIDVGTYRKEARNELGNILERDFLEIKITTPLRSGNAEKSFLRWTMTGVYRFVEAPPPISNMFDPQQTCYVNDDLSKNEILLFNGRETTEETLTRFPALRDIPLNHFFSSGYYITVYQQSLTPEAYRYWDQLRQNANPGSGLFEPTPGSVQGNVQSIDDPGETVLGFFFATQTDTIRWLIRPGEVGNPLQYCYNPTNEEADICRECTFIPGSTLMKPDYWEE